MVGLGGAGKAQLVLSYLRRYQSTSKTIFWSEAGQQSSIDRDGVDLYHLLFNIRLSDNHGTVDAESAMTVVKSWISRSPDATLLVLDRRQGWRRVFRVHGCYFLRLQRLTRGDCAVADMPRRGSLHGRD